MTSDPHNAAPLALLPLATLVLWLICLTVGVLGFCLPYARPYAPPPDYAPTQAQLLSVDIPKPPPIEEPKLPPPDLSPSLPELSTPAPQAPPPIAVPDAPPVTPVAAPSAALAFAVPTQGLTRIVDIDQAAHGAPAASLAPHPAGAGTTGSEPPRPAAPAAPPPVTHLTIGQGEGRQPLPEYPREAALGGQEGTVTLRFTVDETGHISAVQIISPSPWPLLNQAASRAVRQTWHFSPGPRRIYEVPIQFQLNR